MISIEAKNLGLNYRIQKRLTLAPKSQRPKAATGGVLVSQNGKNYVQALKNVSFSLKAGDRLGLVGTNGAGKTTLLKLLYGIYEPSEGELDINGRVDALFNIRLGFRGGASGRRNIELRCLINGWNNQQIAEKIDEIIEFSELGDFIDMPIKSYSQGMAARLAFAAATAMDPEILLMDEWIGAGDASFQEKAKKRMEAMAEKAGIIVIASHNHKLIKSMCNVVLHLDKGEVKTFMPTSEWEG